MCELHILLTMKSRYKQELLILDQPTRLECIASQQTKTFFQIEYGMDSGPVSCAFLVSQPWKKQYHELLNTQYAKHSARGIVIPPSLRILHFAASDISSHEHHDWSLL